MSKNDEDENIQQRLPKRQPEKRRINEIQKAKVEDHVQVQNGMQILDKLSEAVTTITSSLSLIRGNIDELSRKLDSLVNPRTESTWISFGQALAQLYPEISNFIPPFVEQIIMPGEQILPKKSLSGNKMREINLVLSKCFPAQYNQNLCEKAVNDALTKMREKSRNEIYKKLPNVGNCVGVTAYKIIFAYHQDANGKYIPGRDVPNATQRAIYIGDHLIPSSAINEQFFLIVTKTGHKKYTIDYTIPANGFTERCQ